MNFTNISLHIEKDNKSYTIKGLRAQNFNIRNKFLSTHSISDGNWEGKVASSGFHELLLNLEGDYHPSEAQDILKIAAFTNQELNLKISLDNKLIAGKFLISGYEINSKFDGFMEFDVSLNSSSEISFTIIN